VPTYQYACNDCDHAFEQVQSFTEDSLTTCPQCEGRLRKIFNAVGVVFKGSGFYRTDSRAASGSDSASSSSSSDTGSPSGSSASGSSASGSSASGSSASGSSSSSTSAGTGKAAVGAA
jgi:putative FmdB family regulatory protein